MRKEINMECPNPMCKYGPDDNCHNPKHYVKRATKKPVTIEFVEWTGDNLRDVIRFTGRHESSLEWPWDEFERIVEQDGLKIFTLEGHHIATVGDLIIKGVHGEFYPCKPDIFAKTYDVVGA
jgi:hypothetical protein